MPIVLLAFVIVLVLGAVLVTSYISAVVVFKFLKMMTGAMVISPLPTSIKRPLREAREYAQRIKRTAHYCPAGPMKDRLALTVKPVDEWLTNLGRLEQALSKLHVQHNLSREQRRVKLEIEQLRRELLAAGKEELAALRALMDSKKKQRDVLQELMAFQNRAELKIRKIASDLATAHAEMLLVVTKGDFNDNRFQRLDENLQDNLTGLRDMVAVMDEMGYSSAAS